MATKTIFLQLFPAISYRLLVVLLQVKVLWFKLQCQVNSLQERLWACRSWTKRGFVTVMYTKIIPVCLNQSRSQVISFSYQQTKKRLGKIKTVKNKKIGKRYSHSNQENNPPQTNQWPTNPKPKQWIIKNPNQAF